ncbi:MAG: ABC transporter substrate-binding protein [Acidobacteria bacterium]|nr:ABC transporter substrate-binding protein [Acidobacteriota bacterium]
MRARRAAAAALAVALAVVAMLVAGCGGSGPADAVRLGLFLNVTHGPALIGLQQEFAKGLAGLPVEEQVFASGPEEVSALLGGSLDAGYLGPGPYVLAESRAPGRLRLLAGVVTGGQSLVARPGSGIRTVADLRGRRVAVPSHGNTQDLTLRLLLDTADLRAGDQGGDVEVVPVKNSAVGEALKQGVVDAALAPAPYGEKLVDKGDAVAVPRVDAVIDAWRIPATILVVTEEFARANPEATAALVKANAEAVARARRDRLAVARRFNALLAESTGKEIDEDVLLASLADMTPTTDIAPGAMARMVRAAEVSGYSGGPVPPAALVPRPG